jgi:hypothetical protein
MPALIIALMTSGESLAGPMVATILVRRGLAGYCVGIGMGRRILHGCRPFGLPEVKKLRKKIQSSKLTDDMADIDCLRDDIYIKGESA